MSRAAFVRVCRGFDRRHKKINNETVLTSHPPLQSHANLFRLARSVWIYSHQSRIKTLFFVESWSWSWSFCFGFLFVWLLLGFFLGGGGAAAFGFCRIFWRFLSWCIWQKAEEEVESTDETRIQNKWLLTSALNDIFYLTLFRISRTNLWSAPERCPVWWRP